MARPTSGNSRSLKQVMNRAIRTGQAPRRAIARPRLVAADVLVARTSARSDSRSPATSPCARAWTRTLPSAVASTGPATTGSPQASAVSWQSSSFRAPPPTRWTTSTGSPGQPGSVPDRPREGRGEAVQDAADEPGRPVRLGWSAGAQARGDPRRHVARGEERRLVRIERQAARRQRGRRAEQRREVSGVPSRSQVAERLLEQPQAHDVAQVADPAVDAALVREVRRAARLGQHRGVELHADERPGPARDVGERPSVGRHGDDRRGGVVRPDQRHERARRQSRSRAARRAGAGRDVARRRRAAASSVAGRPSAADQLRSHVRRWRRAARSSRRSSARRRAPGEPVGEQVGISSIVRAAAKLGRAAHAASW